MGTCPYNPTRHPLRPDVAEPPSFMQQLPIDERGYPVPWFVQWIEGRPEFRAMDHRKLVRATNERLCWTCGKKLFSEEVFVIGPMCAINRISSEPPSHRECATYAAQNCPFLSKPQMVRRKDGLPEEKHAAGVMIERNPKVTLLWYTRRHQIMKVRHRPGAGDGLLFELGRAHKVEWYSRGRPATRDEVLESIRTGFPILQEYAEREGPAAVAMLEMRYQDALRLVPRL